MKSEEYKCKAFKMHPKDIFSYQAEDIADHSYLDSWSNVLHNHNMHALFH